MCVREGARERERERERERQRQRQRERERMCVVDGHLQVQVSEGGTESSQVSKYPPLYL